MFCTVNDTTAISSVKQMNKNVENSQQKQQQQQLKNSQYIGIKI